MIARNIRFTLLHISKLPLNILTSQPGIKVHRHNILSRCINITKVLLDILSIRHNIRFTRLHICKIQPNYVYLVTAMNGITDNVTKIQRQKSSNKFYNLINQNTVISNKI